MKSLAIFFLLFVFSNQLIVGQTCLGGTTIFTTQGQVDSIPILYPDCVEILGNVFISDEAPGLITNLDSFTQITQINGYLRILSNPELDDLSGLENLSAIGAYLSIVNIPSMTNLSAFSSLTSVSSFVNIVNNPGLTNLDGLQGLTSIGGGLTISNNLGLITLTGLENLSQVNDGVSIINCDELTSFTGLDQLTSIGEDFLISGNFYLESLAGLENLTYFERFRLMFNSNLTSITALSNVTTIGSNIYIYQNDKLASLAGLDNINHLNIDELTILDCDLLTTCHVESICSHLETGGVSNISINTSGCDTPDEVLELCNTVSVDSQLSDEPILLQPNPTSGIVRIETTIETDIQYEVYNAQGKIILIGSGKMIDLSMYPDGVYFIKMINQNEQLFKRIIKVIK